MTNTKALMQILLSEGVPREIVFEFIEAAVETHLDEGTVEDFLLYGLVGAGIEIIAGSEVTQKVIKNGAEELLDSVNDIALSPEARELQRNARKNLKEEAEEQFERTVKANAKEKLEGVRDAGGVGRVNEGSLKADIGAKKDYIFGKATGSKHNIDRSNAMADELTKIGINDTPSNRALIDDHLNNVINDSTNISATEIRKYIAKELPGQPTMSYTATTRESFLMGPNGGVMFETIWEGKRLITIIIKKGK